MGVTVKDVPAREFIEAFAKHLKKGNKIKMPEVSRKKSVFPKLIFAVGLLLQDRLRQGPRPL